MAIESVSITAGTGTSIAADTIGGIQYQAIKLALGADGAMDTVVDSGQQTSANSVPVVIASDQSAINVGTATTVTTVTTLTGGGVADNGVDSGNPIKVGARYNASAPTYADGDRADLQSTVNGYLKVSNADLGAGEDLTNNTQGVTSKLIAASTYSPLLYSELTQVTKANIKSSTGNVVSFYISNDNAAVRYFQLHNKASAPAATEVPIYSFKVPAGTANNPGVLELGTEFFTNAGKNFTTGIGWAISTTYGTFTDSATNTEHIAYVHYI